MQMSVAAKQQPLLQLLPLVQQTCSVVQLEPGQHSAELVQAPPSGTKVAEAQAPLQHCSSGRLQQTVPPQSGPPPGHTHVPATH